jgi:ABC-type multidrug transport system fused ATPase/permease subunit
MEQNMKYPKVPKAGSHIAYAIAVTLLVIFFLYLINPELNVSPGTKRVVVRASAAVALTALALGAFSINWGGKNRQKLFLAQREILTCTVVSQGLAGVPITDVIVEELKRLSERKRIATEAMNEAADFEKTTSTVAQAALVFAMVATIMQAIAG